MKVTAIVCHHKGDFVLKAINIEISRIKTPIAHGLIESIKAVVITVPKVGKYAPTAILF